LRITGGIFAERYFIYENYVEGELLFISTPPTLLLR
jgi:hypothetical protein